MVDSTVNLITRRQQRSINILVLMAIMSMNPWFVFFFLKDDLGLILGVLLSFAAYAISPGSYFSKSNNLGLSLVFVAAAMLGTYGNSFAYVGTLIRCVPFVLFLSASESIKVGVLNTFRTVFFWIIAISLVPWLLYLAGVPLPHSTLTSERIYTFDNYFFFIRGTYHEDAFFPRYRSIFLEPGYVACFISFLIFLDKYNFRKRQNLILLFALILTFSVAGYLLFLIGLIPYMSQRGRMKWVYWIMIAVIVGGYLILTQSSNSVMSMMIGERLSFEDGEWTGYNRASISLEDYWNNVFWKSDNITWGLRKDYETLFDFGSSVDMRAYTVRYGLIGTFFYLLYMVMCYYQNKSRLGLWFSIIVLAFVYRGYSIMFWNATLFVYLAGLTILNRENQNKL